MLNVLKLLLMFFIVSGFSHVLHPTSTGPTVTKREEQQLSQIKPEKQTEIKNQSRNHDYTDKIDETFPTSTVLQNINEKSFLFGTMDKEIMKSKKNYPTERMRQEIVEEERKDKLVSGKEDRENTHEDKKMSTKGEMTKTDIKLASFDQLETLATIRHITPRPFYHQSILQSASNVSTKISSESNQRRDMKATFGLVSEDGNVLVKPQGTKTQTHTTEPTRKPHRADEGEPNSAKQLENDAVSTKSHTRTPQLPQVTKTSSKPQLTYAMPPTKPTKTNKRRKKTLKSPKGKKKPPSPTSFPYFKDDYCPPECACYGRVVQCSDKGVRHVPYGIPYNARYILLMNNHITSIQLDLLSGYESMEFLTISNNWLTDGAIEGAFEGVSALKRLYLDRNLLQSVPVDLPDSLEELRLDNNHLRLMSEAAWTRCPGLLVLSLGNNSLGSGAESLPDGVLFPLSKLRTLNLDYNLLTSVPLGLPPSIRELYLRGNRIKRFFRGVFDGPSELAVLDLSSNRLTTKGLSEDSLLNATHLESLNLAGNRLKQVPLHLPASLKTLNLEGNRIVSIKRATFSTLKDLEHLGLARNKIFKVAPGAFKALPMLHQLDLCHNTLEQVPRQLPSGLSSVVLTHNRIRAVPRDAFCWGEKSLSGLVRVQLQYNFIDTGKLDLQAFRCLRGFQVVHFY